MKRIAFPLISTILLISILSTPAMVPIAVSQEVNNSRVLMLISDGFGWNYYDAKEILESWGVNVTTIAHSLDTDVPSCYNKEPRGTTADMLLNEVENEILSQFDVLFIPSGGQWHDLIQSSRVLDFIEYAHSCGIIVATLCIGNMVLASANNVVNGTSVVSYSYSNSEMLSAGATIRTGYHVVVDNCFITGSSGGGPTSGGYEIAPTMEVCLAAIRKTLGFSFQESTDIVPKTGPSGTTFTINAKITDLDNQPSFIVTGNQNISQVDARIYNKINKTLVDIINLVDDDGDGLYSGEYTSVADGEFMIDIEIEDTDRVLEIVREATSFSVGVDFVIDTFTLSVIAGVALLVIAVVIVVKRKE